MRPEIKFQPSGKRVLVEPDESLLQAAQRAGVPLIATCGGSGTCGGCRLKHLAGLWADPNAQEHRHLTHELLAEKYGLACQRIPHGNLIVEVPQLSPTEPYKIILNSLGEVPALAPAMQRLPLNLPRPSLEDNRADAQRLIDVLESAGCSARLDDLDLLRTLPGLLRQNDYQVVVLVREGQVIDLRPKDTAAGLYGLAIDVGTTSVVAYLMNLETGEQLAVASEANRQATLGADVMSRIHYAMSGQLEALQELGRQTLNDLVDQLCQAANLPAESLVEVVVVGNTSMAHLLAGVTPANLGLAPYIPAFLDSLNVPAAQLGLRVHPRANVHLMPHGGGFVGADAVAGALATGLHRQLEPRLLIDLGTNAELVLGHRDRLLACSAAAGPALEGASIRHGMQAAPGAIDRVWFDENGPRVRTLGRKRARGIAGSGIISAIAACRRQGVLDTRGLFDSERLAGQDWFRVDGEAGAALRLVPARTSATGQDILLTQADVSQVQLARAAIVVGLDVLLEIMELKVTQIEEVLIAGAFGNYLEPDDLLDLGLIPRSLARHLVPVGNSAGAGAVLALLSTHACQEAAEIARRIEYLELSALPDFEDRFTSALPFPEL